MERSAREECESVSEVRFVTARQVSHQEVAEVRELLAVERLGKEVGHVEVRADVKDTEETVTHVITDVVPARLEQVSRAFVLSSVDGLLAVKTVPLLSQSIGGVSCAPIDCSLVNSPSDSVLCETLLRSTSFDRFRQIPLHRLSITLT